MREALFGFTVFLCYFIGLISATVLLKPFSLYFTDLPSKFALVVNDSGVCGALHAADPLDACSSLRNDMKSNITEKMRFALIVRGGCTFEEKIRNAQSGGFRAAIVFDDRDKENLLYMMVNPEGIRIHAVFVSKAAGEILKQLARGQEGECCIYPSHNGTTWTVLAISFISLVVVLALLVIAFFVPRNWLYWQRINHYYSRSLDTKMVEALPCFAFSSARLSDCRNGETCPICLEDYQDGEILKGLPCQHDFHSSCVDSWLTKWGTFCPVCKHDMRTKITYSEGAFCISGVVGSFLTVPQSLKNLRETAW